MVCSILAYVLFYFLGFQKGNNKNVLIKHVYLKQINNSIMKKIMVYFLLLALPVSSFCQKTNDSVPVVETGYLAKSKNQKTAAWILLGRYGIDRNRFPGW